MFRGGPSISNFDGAIQRTSCSPTLLLGSPASTSGTNPTTSAGNTGGVEPSNSTQSDPTLSHGGTPSSQPLGDVNAGDSPSSTGSNGNNGNQGGTNDSNGLQGPTPNRNYLEKLVFTYSTIEGPLQHWGIEGRIRAGSIVHFVGPDDNLRLRSVRILVCPDIIDRITHNAHFNYQYNDSGQVRTIVHGMSLFMLARPKTALTPGNLTMLEDYVQSSEEVCRLLVDHLMYADTLVPEDLPLEVPLLLFGERMHTHPYAVMGSFECAKKSNDANAVEIRYGHDPNGAQIVDPIIAPPPVIAPVPAVQVNQARAQGGVPPIAPCTRLVLKFIVHIGHCPI